VTENDHHRPLMLMRWVTENEMILPIIHIDMLYTRIIYVYIDAHIYDISILYM